MKGVVEVATRKAVDLGLAAGGVGNDCLVEFKVEKLGGDGEVVNLKLVVKKEGWNCRGERTFAPLSSQPSQARSSGRAKVRQRQLGCERGHVEEQEKGVSEEKRERTSE